MDTLSKHSKTRHFVQAGLFNNLRIFSILERRISKLKTEKERGDAFEVFTEAYLATQPIMQTKEVWPFENIPRPLKKKFRLDQAQDMGVDGLLQTTTGEHYAYQAKFRSDRPTLTWTELSTFIGLSDKTDQKLVFTNCNKLSKTIEDREDVFCVRGTDLDRLTQEDFEYILAWLKKHPKPKPKKEPRDYQQEALDAIYEGLINGRRATAVMACGTGKTLLALWVAEKLGYKKILVLVPSLALLGQTLHEWMQETSWDDFSYVCVCSDPTVTKGVDRWQVRPSDFDFPVGTDSKVVTEFLSKRTGGVKVVFSTYQSAQVVAEGITTKAGFDLGIFDEAHKTAGREGAKFGFALKDENLSIRKRLFLTATPRHYNVFKKDREGESALVYSMDNPEVYGERVYTLPFFEASNRNIICGYKVLISVVTSDEVNEELLGKGEVLVEGDEVKVRQVANQISLKRATERYPVKKIFTFHSTVNSAKSFMSEGGEGLHSHLPDFDAFHINGSMPAGERDEILEDFKSSKKSAMSNARCLTEGVNIPAVDMVAFMSPKKSRIDIVQATGRAMRKLGRKKKGYVFIPLFLQKTKDETIEEALDRTGFNEIWNVLQAMQEQDDELVEIISQAVFEKAKTGAKGYEDQKFREKVEVLGLDIDLDVLRKAIATKCIERLGVSWDERYGELVAYKEEYGNCDVPNRHLEIPQLGPWVQRQRMFYRKGLLNQNRTEKLERLEFEWEPIETQWEEMHQALVDYKDQYGDCNVPWKYSDVPSLGPWVNSQRLAYRRNKLSQNRIKKLEILGFVWEFLDTKWEQMYEQLETYQKEHGDCNVSLRSPDELGRWVINQRTAYKKGRLSPERFKELEILGFVWDTLEAQWEEMYEILVDYKREHGDCNVPKRYPENPTFGNWILNQRQNYKKYQLSQDKIERLNGLGFIWDTIDLRWENKYSELLIYREEYGNCNVPSNYSENPNLAMWVGHQRQAYKKGKLSQDKTKQLNELNIVWDIIEFRWEEMYQALLDYKNKHGHCRVPLNYADNPKLGRWVGHQRRMYKKGKLDQDKIKRLEILGFVWKKVLGKSADIQWELMCQELINYRKAFGNCNVSSGYMEKQKLGRWVGTQRQLHRKGKLDSNRAELLEKVGFIWDTSASTWEEMFLELIDYKKQNGDCCVPAGYEVNPKLYNWVGTQKNLYKRGRLSQNRIERLEELGFEWGTHSEIQWGKLYQELIDYKKEHGNCDIPKTTQEDSKLSRWAVEQRRRYKRGELNKEQIKKLEKQEFSWTLKKDHVYNKYWEEQYQSLTDYREEQGDCNVPSKYSRDPALGCWVGRQRKNYKAGVLNQERIDKLEKIGFIWNPKEAQWEQKLEELQNYKDKHSHCNVSAGDLENKQLNKWMQHQRTNYRNNKLSQDRVNKLEGMGFEWESQRRK